MKGRAAPAARRSGNLLRALRIALLAYILVMVAVTAWLTKARSTDWNDTLYMAIYPVNGDRSEPTQGYLAGLEAPAFAPIAEFFAREGARYGLALEDPIAVDLGQEIAEAPPAPPASGNPISIACGACSCAGSWRTGHAHRCLRPTSVRHLYDPQTRAARAPSVSQA